VIEMVGDQEVLHPIKKSDLVLTLNLNSAVTVEVVEDLEEVREVLVHHGVTEKVVLKGNIVVVEALKGNVVVVVEGLEEVREVGVHHGVGEKVVLKGNVVVVLEGIGVVVEQEVLVVVALEEALDVVPLVVTHKCYVLQ